MKKYLLIVVVTLFLLSFLSPIFAGLGVGIGTSKITIDEDLKNGMSYDFPNFVVINTGDITSKYTVDISYNQDQRELLPPKEWFTFAPEIFELKPGESQSVTVKLKIPIDDVIPGNYFAYLEGKPIAESDSGETSVGIAAAAKLSFTIAPSNIIEGIYYTVKDIFIQYQPYSTVLVSAIALFTLRAIFVKFFSFDFNIKSKKKEN